MEFLTLHLFAGAGGGILADKLLGFRPIGAVEIDAYCRQVLLSRQADGCLPDFPLWDDVRTFRRDNPDTRNFIDHCYDIRDRLVLCGGFPCQDISCAGLRAGIFGKRSGLWSEFARTCGEIRPIVAFVENSNQLVRRGVDVVLGDMDELGYDVCWGVLSAADVGAPHLRKRFWGVAVRRDVSHAYRQHSEECCNGIATAPEDNRLDQLCCHVSDSLRSRGIRRFEERQEDQGYEAFVAGRKVVDAIRQRRQNKSDLGGMVDVMGAWLDDCKSGTLWDKNEHFIPRLSDRCPNRRKRLKAIGNGEVPLCAALAFDWLINVINNYAKGGLT